VIRPATKDDIVRALPGSPVVVTGTIAAISDHKITLDSGLIYSMPLNLGDLDVGTKLTFIGLSSPADEQSSSHSLGGTLFALMIDQSADSAPWFALSAEEKIKLARQWREARLKRFIERQHSLREWICFAEIALRRAEIVGSAVPDEGARTLTYDQLVEDHLAGDFEEGGKSRLLYLHPWSKRIRMTSELIQQVREAYAEYPATFRSEYLDHLWLPNKMFCQWAKKHNLSQLLPLFKPASKPPASMATGADEAKATKFLAAHLKSNEHLKKADAAALLLGRRL
jgi:hypothetical protein